MQTGALLLPLVGLRAAQGSHGEHPVAVTWTFPFSSPLTVGQALAGPPAPSSALPFPRDRLRSAIPELLLCSGAAGLAARQPVLVFLSGLQAAVSARRRRWRRLGSPLGSAAWLGLGGSGG